MKSYIIKLNIDNDKIVIDVPEKFIGKKVEIQITEIQKKIKNTPKTFSYVSIKPTNIIDDFPNWFQPNSLNELEDTIENI